MDVDSEFDEPSPCNNISNETYLSVLNFNLDCSVGDNNALDDSIEDIESRDISPILSNLTPIINKHYRSSIYETNDTCSPHCTNKG